MTDQDPRVGGYPLADEANKWGLYLDHFLVAWKESRTMREEDKSGWCRPPFAVALNEFWYVLCEDTGRDGFVEFYKQYEGRALTPDDMALILGRAKITLNRERHLWGYPRPDEDEPYKVTSKPRQGNAGRTP